MTMRGVQADWLLDPGGKGRWPDLSRTLRSWFALLPGIENTPGDWKGSLLAVIGSGDS